LVIGFIVTTTKYNTLDDFHTTNHPTLNLLSELSLVFRYPFPGNGFITISLQLSISLQYNTCSLQLTHYVSLSQCNSFDCRVPEFRSTASLRLVSSRPGFLVIQPRVGQFHREHIHCLAVDVLYCCVFVGTYLPSDCLAMGMARTHIEDTSYNTCSIVAYVYSGRCLTMCLPYCLLRICCGLVY
jgi:hypothetical protein